MILSLSLSNCCQIFKILEQRIREQIPISIIYIAGLIADKTQDINQIRGAQLRRAKADWSGCCLMAVQGALWSAKVISQP